MPVVNVVRLQANLRTLLNGLVAENAPTNKPKRISSVDLIAALEQHVGGTPQTLFLRCGEALSAYGRRKAQQAWFVLGPRAHVDFPYARMLLGHDREASVRPAKVVPSPIDVASVGRLKILSNVEVSGMFVGIVAVRVLRTVPDYVGGEADVFRVVGLAGDTDVTAVCDGSEHLAVEDVPGDDKAEDDSDCSSGVHDDFSVPDFGSGIDDTRPEPPGKRLRASLASGVVADDEGEVDAHDWLASSLAEMLDNEGATEVAELFDR